MSRQVWKLAGILGAIWSDCKKCTVIKCREAEFYINNFFKRQTLKGIQGLALTQNNYGVTILLLKDRFVKNKF